MKHHSHTWTARLIAIGVACVIMVALSPAAMAKTINLNYSIFFPPSHGQCKAGIAWAKEIEKRTDGAVSITVFPGGTLTKANQTYDGVSQGIADIGMSCFAYSRGRFPVMEAIDLPMGYPSGVVATRVANAFYRALNPDELKDVTVLYIHAHGPGLLHTKKPVKSLNDLQGMKIRSTGMSAKVTSALGAVPVAMSQPQAYEALQKGVVEGTFTPIETLKGWKQAEVIQYTTDCADIGYTTAMFVVMNRTKWDALPSNVKKIFEEVSAEWIDRHGAVWDKADAEGRDFTLAQGNEIIALDDAENERWKEAVSPIIDDYIKKANEKGLPGEKIIATLRKNIADAKK